MTSSVGVIGLGNMGVSVLGACLHKGRSCVAVDLDRRKLAELAAGRTVVPEHGIEAILATALAEGRLQTGDTAKATRDCALVFVGVQTPAAGEQCDYTALEAVLRELASTSPDGQVIVIGSTVFPGALAAEILPIFTARPGLEVVYEPVFLRAGYGIDDYLRPGKLVAGTRNPANPPAVLERFFRDVVEVPARYVGYAEAEWIKMIHNAWMGLKISFANEVGALCTEHGVAPADIIDIAFGEGAWGRLLTRSHMKPGPPYSGPCLPKDAQILGGLLAASKHHEWFEQGVCRALRTSNEKHRQDLVQRWLNLGLGSGRPLGIIGTAFRPGFNEMRESLALDFIRAAQGVDAEVLAYDPMFEGIDRQAFALAARQNTFVESLYDTVSQPLERVWCDCEVVLVNRTLSDVERRRIQALGTVPRFVMDLYENGPLQAGRRSEVAA